VEVMNIRRPKENEIQRLAFIETDCFPVAEAASYATLRKRYHAFPENFLVAEVEGRIVGFINGNTGHSTILPDAYYADEHLHDPGGAYMSVFGLSVDPDYQHQGIAHALMNAYIALAKERHKKGIILTCKKALIPFYESFGYKCLGVSDSTHGGAKWNDMFLELTYVQ
jgi:GNAT superfamily N-acetyltransferase